MVDASAFDLAAFEANFENHMKYKMNPFKETTGEIKDVKDRD